MRLWLSLLAATAPLVSGCGTNRPTGAPEGGCGDFPGYPAGPCAKTEKDVGLPVRDLTFSQGWTNPKAQGYDTAALSNVSIHDYYDPDGSKGYVLLILNTSAGWCQACKAEHGGTGSTPSLAKRVEKLGPKGLMILSAYFQDAKVQPADPGDLQAWAETFETNFPFVLDPEYQLGSSFGVPANIAPLNVLVDARTMKIVTGTTGDTLDWSNVESDLEPRE